MARILALDHGSVRCGCAVSDPSGTLATPLRAIERPDSRRGLAAVAQLARELEAERRSVAVVSADRALRQAVGRASVRLIGPRDFLGRVEREAAAGGELPSRQRYQLGDALDAATDFFG
jgi:putative Holliday junction resolvase